MIQILEFKNKLRLGNRASVQNNFTINRYYFNVPKLCVSLITSCSSRRGLGVNLNPKRLLAKRADHYFFSRSGIILPSLFGSRVGVYQGFRFHVFRIRREIVGTRFSELVMTRKLSPNIGLKRSHGYSRKKNIYKKLVAWIIFGCKIDLFT